MDQPRSTPTWLPYALIIVGFGLITAMIIGWVQISRRQASLKSQQGLPYSDIQRIQPSAAKTSYDQQSAVIVDVRGPETFADQHVVGAFNLPVSEIDTRWAELDKTNTIILYCT